MHDLDKTVDKQQNAVWHLSRLVQELRVGDHSDTAYKNFLHMDLSSFHMLLDKVSPLIRKKDTHMRRSIPAEERLALTLRWLATGWYGPVGANYDPQAKYSPPMIADRPASSYPTTGVYWDGDGGEVTPPPHFLPEKGRVTSLLY